MSTLEERVAFLEGRVGEQSKTIDGVREVVIELGHRVHAFEERVDRRFEALDSKIDATRNALDEKMSHHFLWLVGIQVTTLAAIVAALVSR